MMNKKYTHEEVMDSFWQRSNMARQILRKIASQRLVNKGFNEVGSSDINHELVHMFNEFGGDWDEVYLAALEEYYSL